MANPAKNLLGQTFGYLTVIERAGTTQGISTQCATWLCQCLCGNQVVRRSQYLRTKHRKHPRSCGCHHGNETHKMSKTAVFSNYHSMVRRCYDPKDKDFKNYGARGITVCERWQTSFENFWADMGTTHKSGLTLDRIDNNGPYSPENCRWATTKEQGRNTRVNVLIDTPEGRMTIAEAAERRGMQAQTLNARLNRYKWPIGRALNEPLRKKPTTLSTAGQGVDS